MKLTTTSLTCCSSRCGHSALGGSSAPAPEEAWDSAMAARRAWFGLSWCFRSRLRVIGQVPTRARSTHCSIARLSKVVPHGVVQGSSMMSMEIGHRKSVCS